MTIDRLADGIDYAIYLHCTFDLKGPRFLRIGCDADEEHPFHICRNLIVYNLSIKECLVAGSRRVCEMRKCGYRPARLLVPIDTVLDCRADFYAA